MIERDHTISTAAFGLIGTIITIMFLLLYLAARLSVIAYYRQ